MQVIDEVRRHHSKNFFTGVKRIGGFQNKTQLAIGFSKNPDDDNNTQK